MKKETQQHGRVEDLQSHTRVLAMELHVAGVPRDALVRKFGKEVLSEGWEAPVGKAPAPKSFVITEEGLFTSEGPRTIGREVRPIDERDVLPKALEMAVRQRLYATEKRHDIFNKLKQRPKEQ